MMHLSPEWRQKLLDAGFPAEELKLGVAEEILRRLPRTLESAVSLRDHDLRIDAIGKDFSFGIGYFHDEKEWLNNYLIEDSLANAAAAMYCDLAEATLLS